MYGQFFVIFALVLTGFILKERKIVGSEMVPSFNKLILRFAVPCMLLYNIAVIEVSPRIVNNFMICLFLSFLTFFICQAYTVVYSKIRNIPLDRRNVVDLSVILPNNGFMGYPIAYAFYGDIGLLLMVAANTSMQFYMYTAGYMLLERYRDEKKKGFSEFIKSIVIILKNPVIIASGIGCLILVSNIQLPESVLLYFELGAGLCTPLSMMCIGMNIPGTELFKMIKDKIILQTSINKLFVAPMLILFSFILIPVDPIIIAICTLSMAMPTAAVTPALVEEKGQDEVFASKIIVVDSALSVITIPVCVFIINYFLF